VPVSLSIKQLKYFVATAETGQVSQAAVALSISQSAITTAIKDLERTLDAELFHRSSHGMELNEAGQRFLSHAYDVLAKIEEALSVSLSRREIRGTLAVAATYTVIGYFLPYHLDRLNRLYPDLKIQIYEVNRETIEEGLLTNRYDIAVLLTSNLIASDLASETLVSSVRRLWVASRHPLAAISEVSLARISQEPYIMLTVDEAAYTALKYWNKTQYQPNVLLRTSSVEAVRSMVANGQGVAILSDMVYRPWSLEGKRIDTINPSDPVPPMDVGLTWKRNADFSPAVTAFRDYFRSAFQAPNARNPA
jgi:DNA-binding transcriptional LysR family regulator